MKGFVYVLACQGKYKIGWSCNPKSRLSVAKNFNPFPVQMVASFEADKAKEADLHVRFKSSRIRASEWFHGTPEILAWLEGLSVSNEKTDLDEWFADNRGSKVALAKALGVTPGTISQWKMVPPQHMWAVEEFTGIPVDRLRPDIFDGLKKVGAWA